MFQQIDKCNWARRPRNIKEIFYEDLDEYNYFSEVYDNIDGCKIVEKYGDHVRKKSNRINKIIGFVYSLIMTFKRTNNIKGAIFLSNFLDNVNFLIYSKNFTQQEILLAMLTVIVT